MLKVGIVGATGYTGQELIRLLLGHPEVEIKKIVSETYKEKQFDFVYRNFTGFNGVVCQGLDKDTLFDGIDVLFSGLSYGVLMDFLTEDMLNKKVQIIDMGVDYRFMNQEEYKKCYNKEHRSMELAHRFIYGLSEWNEGRIKEAKHIANPGCYATAIQLALLPLIQEDIIESKLIVDGKCGLSGNGRALTIGTHFTEANESTKAYKINNHPHALECEKAFDYFTNKDIKVTFVPHIVPMQRGILITAYTQLKNKMNEDQIRDVFKKYYAEKKFVQVLEKGIYVETRWIRNSNMCHINVELDELSNTLIVIGAIDNLMKGAAGQAVQNMNLMNGFAQDTGLHYIPSCL